MGVRKRTKSRPLVVTVFGTRPQYIKLAVLWRELESRFRSVLIDSGQHYDWELSGALHKDTGLRRPDVHLGIGSAPAASQIGRIADALDRRLARLRPDAVIVIGDTSTTAGGAIAASYRGIPVAHVEAGLRSFDRSAPEEKNRIIADHVATWRFCPTRVSMQNLHAERIREGVYGVGDLMYQHWQEQRRRMAGASLPPGVVPGQYYYVTAHRAENVDEPGRLHALVNILKSLHHPFVYPVHPRTLGNLRRIGLLSDLRRSPLALLIPPVAYSTSLTLVAGARVVITDSGGLQREAYWSRVPCLVIREVTEWPELVSSGASALVGLDSARIRREIVRARPIAPVPDRIFSRRRPASAIASRLLERLRSD